MNLSDLFGRLAPEEKEYREKLQREAAARTLSAYYAQPDRFQGVGREGMPPAEVMTAYKTLTGLPWPSRPVERPPGGTIGQRYGPESEMTVNMPTEVPIPASAVRSPLEGETYGIEERGKATARGQVAGKKVIGDWLGKDYPELSREDVMEKIGVGLPYKTTRGRTMAEKGEDYGFGLEHPTSTLGFAMQEAGYPGTGKITDIVSELAQAQTLLEEKVPAEVKQAQQLVVSLIRQTQPNPVMEILVANNPEKAMDPKIQQLFGGREIPEDVKKAYDNATRIITAYYAQKAGTAEPGAEETTTGEAFKKKWGM